MTGSTRLAILLSARSYCRLSRERLLHPFHLLGPVLLGCCLLQLTSLSSAASTLCEGWGGHPLCLFGDSPVLMDLHWPYDCTAQSSILSTGSVSVDPERSWTIVALPCFTVVKSFTSWYAILLLFFLRISSISPHCSPIRFSFTFSMQLLMLFYFLVFFRPFKFDFCFLSQFSPFIAQTKNFCSAPGFFLLTMFARDLSCCFSHCCAERGDH